MSDKWNDCGGSQPKPCVHVRMHAYGHKLQTFAGKEEEAQGVNFISAAYWIQLSHFAPNVKKLTRSAHMDTLEYTVTVNNCLTNY